MEEAGVMLPARWRTDSQIRSIMKNSKRNKFLTRLSTFLHSKGIKHARFMSGGFMRLLRTLRLLAMTILGDDESGGPQNLYSYCERMG